MSKAKEKWYKGRVTRNTTESAEMYVKAETIEDAGDIMLNSAKNSEGVWIPDETGNNYDQYFADGDNDIEQVTQKTALASITLASVLSECKPAIISIDNKPYMVITYEAKPIKELARILSGEIHEKRRTFSDSETVIELISSMGLEHNIFLADIRNAKLTGTGVTGYGLEWDLNGTMMHFLSTVPIQLPCTIISD
jgi:hypothetical protein